MSGRWWRAYGRARHDPKLLKLSDKHFRWWFNLVCVASDNGGVLPEHADLAVEFRVSSKVMTEALDALVAARLLDHDETGIHPHNWDALQYKSDTSADRMRRHRERHRDGASDVTANVTVTRSESEAETDTEQRREDNSTSRKTLSAEKRGSRLPEDWQPSEEDRAFAVDLGLAPTDVAEGFKDYWHSLPGARGRKLDWSKTFRNRCRDLGKQHLPAAPKETHDQRRIRLGREALRDTP